MDAYDAMLDARSEARYEADPRTEPDTREVAEAYMIDKGGEDYPTRAYGVSYER